MTAPEIATGELDSEASGVGCAAGDALADEADAALAREELSRAVVLYDRAEPAVQEPDRCAGGRWMAYMLEGNFPAAWRESDAIRRRGAPDPHRFWNGEALRGRRLMLRSLHGLGDAVQMFRFLPALRRRVASLVVEVPPNLVSLAKGFAGIDEVITWGANAPLQPTEWEVQMEVMELPYVLRVSAAELHPREGYLHLPEAVCSLAQRAMGVRRQPRVGVVWEAGEWNPSRSIPFAEFSRLLTIPEVEFWSLQGGAARMSWQDLPEPTRGRDVYECGDGLPMLAAVIAQLDLVVTVDTLAAHLAGALGVPCWLLLQRHADWRWMVGREDTPWYGSLRLWRQREAGRWAELVDRVGAALQTAGQEGTWRSAV